MPASAAREVSITTVDAVATRALAGRLATVARAGDLILLHGDLGAGKTEFAKGFGAGLGVRSTINSPSFVLMAEHEGRLPFFHLDLYRLSGASEMVEAGLHDERRESGVTLVEWAERLGVATAPERLDIVIDGAGDDPRSIRLHATSPAYERYLEAAG